MRPLAIALIAFAILSPLAAAQDPEDVGTDITIELVNGDAVTGTLREMTAGELVIEHPHMGILRIPRAAVVPPPPDEEIELVSPWSGAFDVAVTGSRGNTQKQDARLDLRARNDTDKTIDSYLVTFEQSSAEVEVGPPGATTKDTDLTAKRLYIEGRREWRLEDTKWRPFLQGSVEDDKFKTWDKRFAVAAGGVYPVIEEEKERLDTRVGLGASRERGGTDGGWKTEGVMAAEYFVDLENDHSFLGSLEVYPELVDPGEYRSITRAEYRVIVNPDDPWSVKVGAEHIHDTDSDPGQSSTDIAYYLSAGFVF